MTKFYVIILKSMQAVYLLPWPILAATMPLPIE